MNQYILDANIVIKIWDKNPDLFSEIEKVGIVDFKISKNIAIELSQKEYKTLNGIPILSDKFLKLLDHIIDNDIDIDNSILEMTNISIKFNSLTNMYSINDNKISLNDFNLISLCKSNRDYVLVTEDIKLQNSAKLILESNQILTFEEFSKKIKVYLKT